MDEKQFHAVADGTLARLEQELMAALPEADVDLSHDILTVEFGDGEQFVINSHGVARQIWASANQRASHYDWDGAQWKDTKTGEELFAAVRRMVREKTGRA